MRWKTVYLFEYGPTAGYGDFTELNPQPIGNDHRFHEVSEGIGGSTRPRSTTSGSWRSTTRAPSSAPTRPSRHPAPRHRPRHRRRGHCGRGAPVGLVTPNSAATTVRFEYGSRRPTGPLPGQSMSGVPAALAKPPPISAAWRRTPPTTSGSWRQTNMARSPVATRSSPPPRRRHPAPGQEKLVCKKPQVKRHGRCVRTHHRKKHHRKHHHGNTTATRTTGMAKA